jgi:hypothetical protein
VCLVGWVLPNGYAQVTPRGGTMADLTHLVQAVGEFVRSRVGA